ncbi:hypothetical protein EDD16DRAFT_1697600 [Pisolithus croceorrhizus]|nr:hypothetical protein EDD16DRAFT_1697600 [Pisolithus croceorrhizus]KAI6167893.1 hypothetical protein EDD17DRAFT_1773063 [Pisolithus thermaeus]
MSNHDSTSNFHKGHLVEEDVDDIPDCPSKAHFTQQFIGVSMEAVETAKKESMWLPFCTEGEWELAHFLMKNVGQTKMDEFLKLNMVWGTGVSFENACLFLKHVNKLHTGLAWTCEMIDMCGDIIDKDGRLQHEEVELWWHDLVECMQELMGNPAFWEVMSYVPECAYTDVKGKTHIYDERWTSDWWWDMQKKLPEGAVVAPVILSSDKTTLSQFSGDKKVWPVYLTIGNISKDVRHQVLAHVMLLIGYLPVSKLECFHKKTQSLAGYHLFHHVMSLLLCPLVDAGHHRREMICANRHLHGVHPILTVYIADFPEQCLVACKKESQCPCCLVQSNNHGNLEDWESHSLHAVFDPFWKDLPFTDIFACLTPDILHQLHKGIFHDHPVQWCMSIVSEKEIDACFQAMTPTLCRFKKGISLVSQWTGTEHKEMQRVFVGLLAGAVDDCILVVAHALLDFIYYAQLQQHTNMNLVAMQESLKMFHNNKHILIELEICEDFNVPKIHSLQHYVTSI